MQILFDSQFQYTSNQIQFPAYIAIYVLDKHAEIKNIFCDGPQTAPFKYTCFSKLY